MWLANRLFPSVRRLQARAAALEKMVCTASPDPDCGAAFFAMLEQRPSGRLLEIGARMRNTPHLALPPGWTYDGLDIVPAEFVTLVGDAHNLRAVLGPASVDAIFSVATFEHLLMPWKVVIEMNYVLRSGGLVLVASHQAFPIHEWPADYWRFSSNAWHGLFNQFSGFKVLNAEMRRPLCITEHNAKPDVATLGSYPAYLHSCVIAEKISDTNLTWEADPAGILGLEHYPEP